MNARLPDVALNTLTEPQAALDGVGMQDVALGLRLPEPGAEQWVNARASVQVDLPDSKRKGIHMSRLYLLLDGFAEQQVLSPLALARLMAALVESHADCGPCHAMPCHAMPCHAMLTLVLDLMLRRPAPAAPGPAGWKAYPVSLTAERQDGDFALRRDVGVTYSSTCPCSATLSRQLVKQAFMAEFGDQAAVAPHAAANWLLEQGSIATPHSQRIMATISVDLAQGQPDLGMPALIDAAEAALGTPVQTAVRRVDEQAFARLNGAHLMYGEDAALKPAFALRGVRVRHMESLHAHDAVARIGLIG